jgi:hypothetical protein
MHSYGSLAIDQPLLRAPRSGKIEPINLKEILHTQQRPLKFVKARSSRWHFWRAEFWRELRQGSRVNSKFVCSALCVALILTIHGFASDGLASIQSNRNGTSYLPVKTEELLSKPNAIGVKVGAYFDNLHDLSLQNRRFVGEGFYWLEWPQSLQDKLKSDDIESGSMISIANQLDTWDRDIDGIDDEPTRLPNGNYYQQMRFSAHLFIPEINLRRFPFESIELPVILETYSDLLAIENGNLVLIPDVRNNALVSPSAGINGYNLVSASLQSTVRTLGTDWGLSDGKLSYSGAALTVTLRSSPLPSILKYFLPLFIVVGIVLLAPSLEGELGDIRLAIPSTGLLTLIFLQQSYQAEIPQLDYLTFLDWFYACGYVIAIGTFVLFVWGTNFYQKAPQNGKEQALETINKADLVFQLLAIVGTLFTGLLAWFA